MNKFIQFMRLFGLLTLFIIAVIMACFAYHELIAFLETIWPTWGVALFVVLSLALGLAIVIWNEDKW